jgi:hypothetical protein
MPARPGFDSGAGGN